MLLKVKGSSIAEVIIALVIISLCYGIVATVFTRLTRISISTEDLKTQTEIMNNSWNDQRLGIITSDESVQYPYEVTQHNSYDELEVVTYKNGTGVILWHQERLINP